MFLTLDEDGSNTLDMGEITKLFKDNGIHMSIEEVSSMFAEAKLNHL
jgi:hypothetical protein